MNMRRCKKILFNGLFTLLLATLVACQQQEQQPLPQVPLLTVGSRQLTLPQFKQALQDTYPDIAVLTKAEQVQLQEQLLKQLVDRELILSEASRLDVRLTPDEIDAAMVEVRGNYSEVEFTEVLQQMATSPKSWLAAFKLRLLTAKVSNTAIANEIKVSDQEMEDYYRSNREEFRRPVEIRARQMLFKTRTEANKVIELLAAGGSFAALAKQYSQSPDREQGGSLGYFSAGTLPEEFDRILFKMPVRQVSELIESPYGLHIFYVNSKRSAGIRPYVVVKDEIRQLLSQQKEEKAFHAWLETLQQTTKVVIDRQQL